MTAYTDSVAVPFAPLPEGEILRRQDVVSFQLANLLCAFLEHHSDDVSHLIDAVGADDALWKDFVFAGNKRAIEQYRRLRDASASA